MATDKESTDGRKGRKTTPRPTISGKRSTGISEANKRRYQDPAQREHRRQLMLRTISRHKGKWGRPVGSYDGVTKEDRVRINAAAKQTAKETIQKMTDNGTLGPTDDPRAVAALEAAIEVLNTPSNQGTKLQAAKLILEYTKAKPASKSEVTVNKAEEWLATITSEEKNDADKEGDAGDA